MSYLFSNFLTNAQEYKESQLFWENLCSQVLSRYEQSDLWVPWFGVETVEPAEKNAVLYEGNPMYWLVNPTQLKGVRIIQQDPNVHTKWEMAAWTDVSGDEYTELGMTNDLVFTCKLTHKAAEAFEKLFELWIQPSTDVQKIEEFIRTSLY